MKTNIQEEGGGPMGEAAHTFTIRYKTLRTRGGYANGKPETDSQCGGCPASPRAGLRQGPLVGGDQDWRGAGV